MTRPLFALLVALTLAAVAAAQGVDAPEPAVSAEQVQQSIARAVAYLYSIQDAQGTWEDAPTRERWMVSAPDEKIARDRDREFGGRTALPTLALLYAGEDPKGEKLAKALKFLTEIEVHGTYACAIRASVWSKLKDPKAKPLLARDALWLMEAMTRADQSIPGAFSYVKPFPGPHDYSNTQYGVLGLRDAAIRGVEVPAKYWEAIQQNMITGQAPTGAWGYYHAVEPTQTYGSMTVGCLANLYITIDMLQALEGRFNGRDARDCGRRQVPEAVDKALAWMDRNLPVDFGLKQGGDPQLKENQGQHGVGRYYLYGLERCASACGRKTFGGVNWFQEGAKYMMRVQDADGGHKATYFGNQVHTAWAILFLSKGNAPVFFNKLDTKADWNNDPRDMSNLADFMGDALEQRVNWQVIDINDPVETWLDAPVLFFNGHDVPKFTDEQKKKLRLYTDSGGTLVAEACCSKVEFLRAFRQLAKDVWPEWELQALDRKHPLFDFQLKIRGSVPKALHINDGCRSSVFLLVDDASCAWNQNMRAAYQPYFELGLNLARYASDKRQIRSRLFYVPSLFKELAAQGKAVPSDASAADRRIVLADWPTDGRRLTDIRGLRHLTETLKQAAGVTLEVVTLNDQKLDDLDKAAILHMSGHHSFAVSPENLARVQAFIKRGGLVWADAQCGRQAFQESFEPFAKALVPDSTLAQQGKPSLPVRVWARIPATDPLMTGQGLTAQGFDLSRIRYKQAMQMKETSAALQELKSGGRRVLVYSPYDITCGLDGHDCPNCLGPQRNDALMIAANIVLSVPPPETKSP